MVPFLRRVFSKLHNQIVLPLLIASVAVAILATYIAVRVVAGPVERHVREDAQTQAVRARRDFEGTAAEMAKAAQLLAEDRQIQEALVRGDLEMAGRLLVPKAPGLGLDGIVVLDESGEVKLSYGGLFDHGAALGDLPLVRQGVIEMNASDVIKTKRVSVIAGIAPVHDAAGVVAMVIVGTVVDAEYLAGIADDVGGPVAYYDSQGVLAAHALAGVDECVLPVMTPSSSVIASVAAGHPYTTSLLECPAGTYFAAYTRPRLPGGSTGSLAVLRLAGEIAATQRPTAGLIALWSLVAVCFLVLLGIFVAQSISRPIGELALGARHVADGDLHARVEISHAPVEILGLAESFNQMTEGLRERTDSLTKRLLELTALYEMSKAVGTTLDTQHLLETVLDSALKVLGADVGYVMLVDPDTGKLQLKAWRAPSEMLIEEEALSNSIGSWVLREGKPLVFGQRPGARPSLELGSIRTRSALCVPMKSKNAVRGVITVAVLDSDVDLSQENVNLLATIGNQAAIALDNTELFDSLQQAYLATVRALAAAVDAKDPYTHGHSEQVTRYAMLLAEELMLPDEDKHALETAAYLHDIGKIGVKDEILLKPGRLDPDEMSVIKHHPLIGANILAPVPFPWPIIPIVRHHHEHWDGAGYPAGLVGEEIPKLARVLAIADAFEAMTSDRPYRRANTPKQAIEELHKFAGKQFDPQMVEPFLAALERTEAAADNVRVLPTIAAEWADEDEVAAVFVAVADSLLGSLRRLGGPRVATNFQHQMNAHFRERGMPVSFDSGHLATRFEHDTPASQQVAVFKEVLAAEMYAVERNAGSGIAEHFYTDAIESLPTRHRHLASHFGFGRASGDDST